MVEELAAQSIKIKCKMNKSVLTGNYELYYACGLYCRLKGIRIETGLKPTEIHDKVAEVAKAEDTEDPQLKYLAKMIVEYRVEEPYDEQMDELLAMGLNEEKPW